MKIVLGGSRKIEAVPEVFKIQLSVWFGESCDFLIGDSTGVDYAFQTILNNARFERVKIFTSADAVRTNLGDWPVVRIDSGLKGNSKSKHAFKDRHMCQLADIGLMVWDGASAGTISNVIDLVNQGKKTLVWSAPEKSLYEFASSSALNDWLNKNPSASNEARRRLRSYDLRIQKLRKFDIAPSLFDKL
jgi:hypothetical protein